MAKFLKTQGISYHLEELINGAKQKIYLISPYLQINNQIKLLLQDSSSKFTKISVVYGKNKDLNEDDLKWLNSTKRVSVHYYETLHAKCYISEKEAIISSMNLYMFSQQNNCEMGIYITKEDDPQMFDEVLKEAERIVRQSDELPKSKASAFTFHVEEESNKFKKKAKFAPHYGYCIRTGTQIPFNPESPMCFKAFQSWANYSDPNYQESYCHFSGEPSNGDTSYNKPILKKNWWQAKEMFNL